MNKMLVIDDEPEIIELFKRTFELEEIEVIAAYNGDQALHQMSEYLFNIVITDIRLPDTDGKILIPQLKEINPLVNIVVITGYSSMENVVGCLGGGAVDYFTKPFKDMDLIIATVKALFEKVKRWKKAVILKQKS